MLIDTHCHIHNPDYPISVEDVLYKAKQAEVTQMICVGTDIENSKLAIDLSKKHDEIFATVGVHPHYASGGLGDLESLVSSNMGGVVAIGEIGLDYYYDNSPRKAQIELFESQVDLALKYGLPMVFHVREAYDDFWPILDNFTLAEKQIKGLLHCFTDNQKNAEHGLQRGFYFSLNGISTFTRDESQKAVFASLPMDRIMLETDAPYLTPASLRGKISVNEPAYIREIAEYNSSIRGMDLREFAATTTENARSFFNL